MTITYLGLSLWRPWAAVVASGDKLIENRKSPPPSRLLRQGTRVLIHAAQRWDGYATVHHAALRAWLTDAGANEEPHPTGIVGVCRVIGALHLPRPGDPASARSASRLAVRAREVWCEHRDRWATGPWCWILDEMLRLPRAVPCRGMQALGWTPPPDVLDQVRAQLVEEPDDLRVREVPR